MALSRTHDLLTDANWVSADLMDVVYRAVGPISGEPGERLHVAGPVLNLKPQLALSLATVLNELSTNAAKYGSLSALTGKVSISWTVSDDGGNRNLHLLWEEAGGPAVADPTHKGFGARVIERSLRQEHGAQVGINYLPTGVKCTFEVPLG